MDVVAPVFWNICFLSSCSVHLPKRSRVVLDLNAHISRQKIHFNLKWKWRIYVYTWTCQQKIWFMSQSCQMQFCSLSYRHTRLFPLKCPPLWMAYIMVRVKCKLRGIDGYSFMHSRKHFIQTLKNQVCAHSSYSMCPFGHKYTAFIYPQKNFFKWTMRHFSESAPVRT